MASEKNQRVKKKIPHPSNISNRQSFDPDGPVDLHNRPVDYLTDEEVKKLITGTKGSRNPGRDALLILMMFRQHGLGRLSLETHTELVCLILIGMVSYITSLLVLWYKAGQPDGAETCILDQIISRNVPVLGRVAARVRGAQE